MHLRASTAVLLQASGVKRYFGKPNSTAKLVYTRATPSPSNEVKISEGRTYELLRNSRC
jgi:hypothetical protein